MRGVTSISLSKECKKQLEKASRSRGLTQSELIREALRQYLIREEFRALRQETVREADKRGGPYTDEQIFKEIS